MRIPLFKPVIREEAIQAVAEVLRSGWLGLGPKTATFEANFADYIGIPYCIGLNSCSSALHLAVRLLDFPPGTEIITTPLTFVSTNHAIIYERCQPIFADIQRNTGNLDISSVAERLTEKTKAIMLVHYGGYPCDLDEFYALARDRGIHIIEDCAHACGATYRGKRIGSHGELHAFSFHAVKNLPMGDGGALTVRSPEYYERLRRLRWLGITSDTYSRNQTGGYQWDYDVPEVGYKYHMNDIHAAIGLVQLEWLEGENHRRAEIAAQYRSQLTNTPGIELLDYQTDRSSSYHLFPILAQQRERLIEKLHLNEIDVGVHYKRNDQFPMYEESSLPNAEVFWRHEISLPMHMQLSDEQVQKITDLIRGGW